MLRTALAPLANEIRAAFVFGSVAKREDSSTSDVDLMVISDTLTYGELFESLARAEQQLGRKVNPKVYSPAELAKRMRGKNSFVTSCWPSRRSG